MSASTVQSVALPAIVDLDTLDAFRDTLADAVEQGAVAVDGALVERVATNALMMLLSAAETARRHTTKFTVVNPSEPMQSAIDRLGLQPHFDKLIKG